MKLTQLERSKTDLKRVSYAINKFLELFCIKIQFLILIIWFSLLSGLGVKYWKSQGPWCKTSQDLELLAPGLRVDS
jgi:hypothetical protein